MPQFEECPRCIKKGLSFKGMKAVKFLETTDKNNAQQMKERALENVLKILSWYVAQNTDLKIISNY